MNCSNEGIRKDSALFEWLIFLQRWLNQPASAYNLKQIQHLKKRQNKNWTRSGIKKVTQRTSMKTSKDLTANYWFNWMSMYSSMEREQWSLKGNFCIKKGVQMLQFEFLSWLKLHCYSPCKYYLFQRKCIYPKVLCNQTCNTIIEEQRLQTWHVLELLLPRSHNSETMKKACV